MRPLIVATAAICRAASPACADETRLASVVASTDDFATAQARAKLDHRIQSAAEEVCGDNAMAAGISWFAIKECRREVRQEIYGQLASFIPLPDVRLKGR